MRIFHRQRVQQDRLCNYKNCRIQANPQRRQSTTTKVRLYLFVELTIYSSLSKQASNFRKQTRNVAILFTSAFLISVGVNNSYTLAGSFRTGMPARRISRRSRRCL
jgi:hypothetical protein